VASVESMAFPFASAFRQVSSVNGLELTKCSSDGCFGHRKTFVRFGGKGQKGLFGP